MTRYIAVDNTSSAAYPGWELVDTEAVPWRTFAIAMPEYEAKLAAAAMNGAALMTEQAKADIAYLLEAYDYGQFADDMLDHPSAACRSPCKSLREALRRHLDWLGSSTLKEGA